ncbi:histidine triad nucleotide-binding protein 3-like [Parambassis ranga]|uniref:Histidine triad nucleotide-binding protein 3-like n=1 Tax=Parambassis ranga TaxID=210632 RepID=A0A6P7HDS1_9TELE|nr:histidine triad nucleotide-binding protein 3-like [Parambassis ranga]
MESSGSEACPFCQIVSNHTDTGILLSDDELVCFRDTKPGATHHYLIIPRTHIATCKSLHRDHIPLVEQMEEMGRRILEKNQVCDFGDVRMEFHVPLFSSVPHLHLHALAPASEMNIRSQLRYGQRSHWFITVDQVLSQLKTNGRVK